MLVSYVVVGSVELGQGVVTDTVDVSGMLVTGIVTGTVELRQGVDDDSVVVCTGTEPVGMIAVLDAW